MSNDDLGYRVANLLSPFVDAADTCIDFENYEPASFLVFKGIDRAVCLLSANKYCVEREVFCAWIDRYMRVEEELGCTAQDLFGVYHQLFYRDLCDRNSNALNRGKRITFRWNDGSFPSETDVSEIGKNVGYGAPLSVSGFDFVDAFSLAAQGFPLEVSNLPAPTKTLIKGNLKRFDGDVVF